MVVFGGSLLLSEKVTNELWVFNFSNMSWTQIPTEANLNEVSKTECVVACTLCPSIPTLNLFYTTTMSLLVREFISLPTKRLPFDEVDQPKMTLLLTHPH